VLGRFLFRWRDVIGVLAFGVVFWLARPTFGSCFAGLPFLLAGLAIRFWASGYIGVEGRVREIGGQREERGVRREEEGTPHRRIVTGPYRILRHPLYIGNFLLVVGMLVALRPAWWLMVVVLVGFIAEYGLIVAAEEKDLAGRRIQSSESRIQNAEVRTANGALSDRGRRGQGLEAGGRSQKLEARSESAEQPAWGSEPRDKSEAKGQKPKAKAGANGARLEASGEQFLVVRALCEWRTWVVTGVAWGLAIVKALV